MGFCLALQSCGESQLPAPLAAGEDEGQKPIFYRGQTHPPPRQHRGGTRSCKQSCWNPQGSQSLSPSPQPCSPHCSQCAIHYRWLTRPNVPSQAQTQRHHNRGRVLSAGKLMRCRGTHGSSWQWMQGKRFWGRQGWIGLSDLRMGGCTLSSLNLSEQQNSLHSQHCQ